MEYITPKEAAQKWGISLRQVQSYCSDCKINGVLRVGHQWLIPSDAQRPTDGRMKKEKETVKAESYRFPMLVYTKYYACPQELSSEEQELLNAQLLFFKGKYLESINVCRNLTASHYTSSLRFGAYATIGLCSKSLGMYKQLLSCQASMEKIRDMDPAHEADYNMIIIAGKYLCTTVDSDLKNIDIDNLSADAVITYQCTELIHMGFSKKKESLTALRTFTSIAHQLELAGLNPPLLIFHGALCAIAARLGDKQRQIRHIEKACRIGYDCGFDGILAKYSCLAPVEYHVCLRQYGSDYDKKINNTYKSGAKGWVSVYNALHKIRTFPSLSADENEVMLLISYEMSNEELARMMNTGTADIEALIEKICKNLNIKTREELVQYSQYILDTNLGFIAPSKQPVDNNV